MVTVTAFFDWTRQLELFAQPPTFEVENSVNGLEQLANHLEKKEKKRKNKIYFDKKKQKNITLYFFSFFKDSQTNARGHSAIAPNYVI